MTCPDSESLILAERDGALTKEQSAALSGHVAACPSCQRLRADLAAALDIFRADLARVRVPDVNEAWRDLQSRLHEPAKPTKKSPLAPVIWFGAPMAAAAAIALMLFSGRPPAPLAPPPPPPAAVAAAAAIDLPPAPAPTYAVSPALALAITDEVARADYVEAGDANASTMVYVDKESGWLVVWATDVADSQTSG